MNRPTKTSFRLRLYVAGDAHNSAQTIANLQTISRELLLEPPEIEIVDILREPQRGLADGVLLAPTLVKVFPEPPARITGTLDRAEPVRQLLGASPDPAAKPPSIAADTPDEVTALLARLHDTHQRLQVLTGGGVDAVVLPTGESYLLHAAQEKLRLSEIAHRDLTTSQTSILNALPAHIALLDHSGVILAVNESWRRFASTQGLMDPTSAVGQNYLEACARAQGEGTEDARRAAAGIQAVLAGAVPDYTQEYPCHSPTEKRWFKLQVSPLDRGGPRGVVVVHGDITARKLAEAGLLQSEQEQRQLATQLQVEKSRLLAAQSVAKVGSWETDLKTLAVVWSDETHRIFGTNPATFAATHAGFLKLVHPADRAAVDQAFRQSHATSGAHVIEHRVLQPDGRSKFIEERWQIYGDGAARPLRAIGTSQDITERRLHEHQLHRLNRLHMVLSKTGEAILRLRDRRSLYQEVCRIVAEDGLLRMAFIAEPDSTTGRIEPVASAGTGLEYLHDLRITTDGPLSLGTVGTAFRTGRPDYCNDFCGDPRMGPWRDSALRHGFHSTASFPIQRAETTLGALVLFAGEADFFQDDELRLMSAVANNLALALTALEEEQQRTRVEEKLRDRGTLLSMAGRVAKLGGWSCTVPQIELLWSDETAVLHDEAAGFTPNVDGALNYYPDEHREAIRHAFETCVREGTPFDVEAELLTARGHRIWVRSIGEAVRNPAGDIVRVQGALQDISDRKQAAEKLREQAALIDQTHDAIVVRDLSDHCTFWNQGAERVYGWTAAEAVGRPLRELLQSEPEAFNSAFATVQREGIWIGEIQKWDRQGNALIIDGRWTLLRDSAGRPKSILSIDSDITERKKIEQQFLRAQRMESIGTLAGGIAHDLNNLLAPITMGVDLLKMQELGPRNAGIIGNMERSARRGADLVKQVLSFARGVEGTRVALHPRQIFQEVESIIESTFPKNITVETSLPQDLWPVLADPTQLNQVVLNLCVNARDAMPEGGHIKLAANNEVFDQQYAVMNRGVAAGRYVAIEVTDDGCGMPKEVIDRIFEPFFTTKEVGKGTGLGLSTVLGIVRSHGGFVNVYSEPGKGSTFRVCLPAQPAGADSEQSGETSSKLPQGNGELILVVDDEASIREITQQTLEAFGYEVLTAEDGARAIGLYALHRDSVALVLTDMMMPVMDGPALINALKRIDPNVHIIAASGLSANANVARAANAGVTEFIPKPYSADVLLKKIKACLHR